MDGWFTKTGDKDFFAAFLIIWVCWWTFTSVIYLHTWSEWCVVVKLQAICLSSTKTGTERRVFLSPRVAVAPSQCAGTEVWIKSLLHKRRDSHKVARPPCDIWLHGNWACPLPKILFLHERERQWQTQGETALICHQPISESPFLHKKLNRNKILFHSNVLFRTSRAFLYIVLALSSASCLSFCLRCNQLHTECSLSVFS